MPLPGTITGSLWTAKVGATAGDIGISAVSGGVDIVDPGTGDSDKYLQGGDGAALTLDISASGDRLGAAGIVYRQSLVLYAETTGSITETFGKEIITQVNAGGATSGFVISMVDQPTGGDMPRTGFGFYRNGALAAGDSLEPMGGSNTYDIAVDRDTKFTLESTMLRHASAGYLAYYLNGKCVIANYNLDTNTVSPQSGWQITLPALPGIRWRVYPNIVGDANPVTRTHQAQTEPGNVQYHLCPAIGGDRGDFDYTDSANAVITRNDFIGLGSNTLTCRRTEARMSSSVGTAVETSVHTSAFDIGALKFHNGFCTIMMGDAFAIGAIPAGKSILMEVFNAANDTVLASINLNADGTVDDRLTTGLFTTVAGKRYNIGLVFGSDGTTSIWAYNMTDPMSVARLVYTAAGASWTVGNIGKIKITMACNASGGEGTDYIGYTHVLVVAPMVIVYPDSLDGFIQVITGSPDVRTLKEYGSMFSGQFEVGSVPNGHRTGKLNYKISDWAMYGGSNPGGSFINADVSVRPFVDANMRGVRLVVTGISINDIRETKAITTHRHDALINAYMQGTGNEIWWGTDVKRPEGITVGPPAPQNWTAAEMTDILEINTAAISTLKRHQTEGRIKVSDVSAAIATHTDLFTANADDTHPNAAGYRTLKQTFSDNLLTLAEDGSGLIDRLLSLYEFNDAIDSYGQNTLLLGGQGTFEAATLLGNALSYDGTPNTARRINLVDGHNITPPIGTDLTIAGWYYLSATTPDFGALWAMSSNGRARGIVIHTWPGDKFRIYHNGTTSTSTGTFIRDAWNLIEVSHVHGVGPSLYINNVLSDSFSFTDQLLDSTDFGWAVMGEVGGNILLNSKCSQLGIWHKKFTPSLRTRLYNGGAGLPLSRFGGGRTTQRIITAMSA